MEKALKNQIGGNHYKSMPFQPVELFAKTRCTAFQANIWKYITRYKLKNGAQDIEKCIHYAELAKELKCNGLLLQDKMQYVHAFCRINNLSELVRQIVISAGLDEYGTVIEKCKKLLKKEYLIDQ